MWQANAKRALLCSLIIIFPIIYATKSNPTQRALAWRQMTRYYVYTSAAGYRGLTKLHSVCRRANVVKWQQRVLGATHNLCFIFPQKLLVDSHLHEDLYARFADRIAAVLVAWKLLLFQQQHFPFLVSQIVSQSGPRRPSSHYHHVVVRAVNALGREWMNSKDCSVILMYDRLPRFHFSSLSDLSSPFRPEISLETW